MRLRTRPPLPTYLPGDGIESKVVKKPDSTELQHEG